MSNQRLMKVKEKAGDGYAKTNAIGGSGYGLALFGGRFTGTPHRRLVAVRDPGRGGESVVRWVPRRWR